MARKASGADQLDRAMLALRLAKTADELRAAQAVVLPLALGLSLKQTAQAIGRSVGTTCSLRIRYCQVARGERHAPRGKRALRNRANVSLQREAQIIEKGIRRAAHAGAAPVPLLRANLEKALGKPVALSTIYRMLARHGWRKLPSKAGWYKS
jgi:hypothetical protein